MLDLNQSVRRAGGGTSVSESGQSSVQAPVVEELRRLHEGVLARYGPRPSEHTAWKAVYGR